MALVKFYRGLEKFYSTDKFGTDGLYFATDTGVLFLNGVKYGFNPEDENLNILSAAGWQSPDTILFTCTNGKTISVKLPTAGVTGDTYHTGLMSALDKETFDKIPELYATKEELKNELVGIYHFRGVVETLNDLPKEGMEVGDVYRIRQEFVLDGQPYAAGSHVVYTSTGWHAMEGEEPGYSKSEADEKFIAWVEDENTNKLIILPKGSKVIGTMIDNDGANLLQLGIYDTESGQIQQVELGSTKLHLTLNSSDRPNVDLPGGVKETLAYESDIKDVVKWAEPEHKNIIFPKDGSITFIQDEETGSGGVLVCQRDYGEGNVTEISNLRNKLTLNATERPQIDLADGTKEKMAFESDLIKYGMYYPGVKVDTQKLFALTKASTEDDIKAALQLETASGSYTLPTEEILNDCLGKGYQLLSNWMPVSVAWNGAAWVFYIVGQTYMNQPNSVATVSIKITDGVYSVFQAAKITELVDTDDIRTLPREVNIPIRTLQDRVYTQDEILEWFGVTTVAGLKSIISTGGIQYLRYGILLSGNPYYYKMPIEYCAFESANQVKLVFNGLNTRNDVPSKYEIILNLDGTIVSGQSNVGITITALANSEDLEYVKRMVGSMELKADTVTGQFIPALEQSYIDDLGTPENINGKPYNTTSNNYTIGGKYYVLGYFDDSLVFHYDMYSLSADMGIIVDSALNQFKSVDNDITDIQNTLTWNDITE